MGQQPQEFYFGAFLFSVWFIGYRTRKNDNTERLYTIVTRGYARSVLYFQIKRNVHYTQWMLYAQPNKNHHLLAVVAKNKKVWKIPVYKTGFRSYILRSAEAGVER